MAGRCSRSITPHRNGLATEKSPHAFSLAGDNIRPMGTLYHGNLWIPKTFPDNDSVSGLSTESPPVRGYILISQGVTARGQSCAGLQGLSSASPLGLASDGSP